MKSKTATLIESVVGYSNGEVFELAGVPEGTEIQTPTGESNEVMVYDRDDTGNVIGWHKEAGK